jgi:hypothetical protein
MGEIDQNIARKTLIKLAKQLKHREQYKRRNPLLFLQTYDPKLSPLPPGILRLNKAQTEFLLCTRSDGKLPKRIILRGHNKAGKTAIVVIRCVCFAVGKHPFLPKDHPLYDLTQFVPIPNQGMIVGEKLTQSIQHKIIPEFRKWIPEICQPVYKKNPQGIPTQITLQYDLDGNPLGSVIFCRSLDQEPSSFEGIDYEYVLYDEPPNEKVYVAAERGLVATGGYSMIAMTHLKEVWINDLEDQSIDMGGQDENIRIIETGNIWENVIEKGGFLTQESVDEFIKIVPKEEYDARILGQAMARGSRIFSSFVDEFPYVIPNYDIPKHWTKIEGIDPADGKDTKYLFMAVSPYDISIFNNVVNRVFVFDYMNFPPGMSLADMVVEIKRRRLQHHYDNPYIIKMDGKYGARRSARMDRKEPSTWQEKLELAGLGYISLSENRPGSVDLGHKQIIEYLRPQYSKIDECEIPGIVFMERCRGEGGPIEAMKKYRRKPNSDEPEEKYKDFIDILRYVLEDYPIYMDPRRRMFRGVDMKRVGRYTGR